MHRWVVSRLPTGCLPAEAWKAVTAGRVFKAQSGQTRQPRKGTVAEEHWHHHVLRRDVRIASKAEVDGVPAAGSRAGSGQTASDQYQTSAAHVQKHLSLTRVLY